MNYKALCHITLLLISSPARAWEEIRLKEDRKSILSTFVYPMIGLCGLSVFIGSLMSVGWSGPLSFQYAMTRCCAVAVSLFGGYFLAAYLINGFCTRFLSMENNLALVQQFAGYALVIFFLRQIIIGIWPEIYIIALLLQFYTIYVVWEGVTILLMVEDKNRLRLTIVASILLLLSPEIIERIFDKLVSLLN